MNKNDNGLILRYDGITYNCTNIKECDNFKLGNLYKIRYKGYTGVRHIHEPFDIYAICHHIRIQTHNKKIIHITIDLQVVLSASSEVFRIGEIFRVYSDYEKVSYTHPWYTVYPIEN